MSEPQFFQTAMGRTFFDSTMPRIAESLEALVENQAKQAEVAAQLPILIESIRALNANLGRIADALAAKEATQ